MFGLAGKERGVERLAGALLRLIMMTRQAHRRRRIIDDCMHLQPRLCHCVVPLSQYRKIVPLRLSLLLGIRDMSSVHSS